MIGRAPAAALTLVALALLAMLALPGVAGAQESPCTAGEAPPAEPGGGPLRFGIYPGGPAGQLGPIPADSKPEDQGKIDAALAELRPPAGPFVVHLYGAYMEDERDAREMRRLERQVQAYTAKGYEVEIVLRYRRDDDVAGFARFLRGAVARFGSNPRFVAIQVANEVNFTVSPDSSDGAYKGARDALIQGVIAAKDEARQRGFRQLEIGFNWVYRLDTKSEQDFWGHLRDHGGPQFVGSLDWVGLDIYPGTFFPPSGGSAVTRTSLLDAFGLLRRCYLPQARIPAGVPIHIQESGYPTGPGRSYEEQVAVLEQLIGTTWEYRRTFNVTDYRWFDLRDADTDSPNLQQQYGLMRDDYTPKPAFEAYRAHVHGKSPREGGGGDAGGGSGGDRGGRGGPDGARPRLALRLRCYRRGLRAELTTDTPLRHVDFRASRGRRIRDVRAPFRRSVRVRGRRRVAISAVARTVTGRSYVMRRATRRCGR